MQWHRKGRPGEWSGWTACSTLPFRVGVPGVVALDSFGKYFPKLGFVEAASV